LHGRTSGVRSQKSEVQKSEERGKERCWTLAIPLLTFDF
jgi:hypothetical protein